MTVGTKETRMGGIGASDTNNNNNHDHTTTTSAKKTKFDQDKQRHSSATCDEVEEADFEAEEQGNCVDSDDAEPIGEVIRVSDQGGEIRHHFQSFRFDGKVFSLGDTVLVAPEQGKLKPSVATIKDIFQTEGDDVTVSGQRFYRLEEVEKKEGGTWQSQDERELFYSSQIDELDALNVMHKCVIHLVPRGKKMPDRKKEPGFIVQKVYDIARQKLRYLVDRDCEDV